MCWHRFFGNVSSLSSTIRMTVDESDDHTDYVTWIPSVVYAWVICFLSQNRDRQNRDRQKRYGHNLVWDLTRGFNLPLRPSSIPSLTKLPFSVVRHNHRGVFYRKTDCWRLTDGQTHLTTFRARSPGGRTLLLLPRAPNTLVMPLGVIHIPLPQNRSHLILLTASF
jgi:hypothetical protein